MDHSNLYLNSFEEASNDNSYSSSSDEESTREHCDMPGIGMEKEEQRKIKGN
jgi:hypothetical protein